MRSPTWRVPVALLAAVAAASAVAADRSALVGQNAPDFALRQINGPNVRLSEQLGDVIVLAFWSSRCNPCRAHLAELEQLYAGLRDQGLIVYGINVDDNIRAAREFGAAQRVRFPLLLDPAKQVARAYRVDALPLMVTIDRRGIVRTIRRDAKTDAPRLAANEIRQLLAE
ncbi:MAG: TlpA disulfide reductase family protein [Gammaproteobacteria bacterium]|nr:TlpA disulfide reductase family protein [Gammaproteobacteria bacterium]